MHAEIGHIALIIAFMIAITQSVIPLIGARQRDARLMLFGDRAAIAQLLLTALSFIALTFVFLQSDFSVKLAALHSHTAKPLEPRFTRPWFGVSSPLFIFGLRWFFCRLFICYCCPD